MANHGCCADKACDENTCMELPAGKTCGHCVHEYRCCTMFGHKPSDTYCDWFPRRFREVPAADIEFRSWLIELRQKPSRPPIDESKMPPRPAGSNDANTDPSSPLVRYGRASKDSGLLLEPMADGYWTPWHIANEMLREAQRKGLDE